MKVDPMPGIVYLKLEKATAGVLDTESKDVVVEIAEVISVGEMPKDEWESSKYKLQPGDRVFVKGWAVDGILHEGTWYRFVNVETGGILAKIT